MKYLLILLLASCSTHPRYNWKRTGKLYEEEICVRPDGTKRRFVLVQFDTVGFATFKKLEK